MGLRVAFTRAVLVSAEAAFLQWDIRDAFESGTYQTDLYRSMSPAGPWALVDSSPGMYSAVDKFSVESTGTVSAIREPNVLSLARNAYYKIVVTPPSGINNQVYDVTPLEPGLEGRQKNARRKILRDARVLLAKGNGTPVAVCKKARWGTKCAECVDLYSGEIMRGECLRCYGTGFTPGYMTPVLTYARRSPTAVQSQMTESGKVDVNVVAITLLDIPKVQDDDMIVFLRDNARFIVKTSGQTELQAVGVHQDITASELAYSSIEYSFPVDPYTVPALF